MKKRILSIVLAICMVLSCVPITVFAANADATELQGKFDNGGTVKLTKDYAIDETLILKKNTTLDLNGYVIRMTAEKRLIKVYSSTSLTLKDSNSTRKHTGENASLPNGGVITGGRAIDTKIGMTRQTSGGAIIFSTQCKFIMEGGTIHDCQSLEQGGALYFSIGCQFNMKGGTIENCISEAGGGAAYFPSNTSEPATMSMSGGTIRNCTAAIGGGIFFEGNNTFTMTGGVIEGCVSKRNSFGYMSDAFHIAKSRFIANGGTIKSEAFVGAKVQIENTDSNSCTKFYNEVVSLGTISGGVYYGGINNITANVIMNDVSNTYTGTVTGTCYKVNFKLNGADGSIPNQWFVNTNKEPALKPDDPTRDGYEFRGWYNGNTFYNFTKPVTGNITLTAKWALNNVSTEAELRQAINDGASKIKLIGDINLTSPLVLNDKVIQLDLNGHVLKGNLLQGAYILLSATNSSSSYGAILVLKDSNPTATHTDSSLPSGGVLDCAIGLNVDDSNIYSCTLNADGGTVTGLVSLNHTRTYIRHTSGNTTPTAFMKNVSSLYGSIYSGIYYGGIKEELIKGNTVTFKNGDDIYAKEIVSNEYVDGSSRPGVAVAPIEPVKDGYVFAGWYNGSTKYDFPQTITSDITLTAKWINEVNSEATLRTAIDAGVNPIKLMADINLSSALDLSQKNVTIDLNGHVISGADISINTGNGKASLTLIDSNPTATHTDNTLPKGGVVTSKISMKQSGGGYNDCVLYANGGTVTSEFNTNTNAVAIKCTSDTPTAFTGKISGYTHLYGGIYYGTIASTVTIEAKKITFKNGNDTYAYEIIDSGNNTVSPISPSVKEGYNSFDGWYNGDTKYTFGYSLSEDITLTAKYGNLITYNISYNLNGGTVSPENPGDYTIESEDITLNNPVKTGYTFTGWSGTGLTGENNMTVTIPKESTGNRFYTAHFSQSSYTVKFDTVGGSGISDKTGVKWDDTVLSGITNPTKVGCEFTGWKCGDMTVNAFTKYSDLVANDTVKSVTLVAQWKDTEKPVITGLEKGKTYCDTVQFEVSDNVGVASVQVNYVELKPGTDGKYTLTAGFGMAIVEATDNAGNETAVTVTVNNGHTAGTDDGNCSTPVYCIYHPNTVVVKAKSHDFSGEWNKDKDGHWHTCQNVGCNVAEPKASHSGTDDGDCTTAVICECGYIITAANAKHSYGAWQSKGNNTHTRYCTVTGCKGSETKNCSGGAATYFKKAVCQDCNAEYGELLTDTTAPTGEITIGTNKWNSFLNTITFGLFFKNTQSVTVTATDDSYTHAGYTDDKAVKVEYLLSDKELSKTDLAGKEFTEYGSAFNINPDNKYVVYVKLTDHPGNVTYISSNGVVLDATVPAITGVTDGAVYYTTQKAVVTDDNLEAVTLNGVSVDGTTVTLDGNTDEVYTIVATDKSGNSKTVTVTMKPISSLAQSIDDINGENVNSSNKEAIEAVKESVGEVDILNATDSEKEALNDINGRCDELLDIIDKAQKATETENIKNVEGINPDNVTKNDREALEKAKADLEKALEEYGSNYTDDEKAKIQSDLERVNKSLKVLDDVKAVEDSIASLPDTFKPDDLDTVQKIQDSKKSYDALTDYEKSLVSKDTKAKLDTLTKGITAYAFYEGSGGIWTIGQEGTLTFTANGAYSKFTGIKVDGKDVDHSNYTAKSGSTIISLNAGYLNTLSVGTHTLTVLYTDGEAEMDFEVKAIKKDTEETTMPKEPVSTEEITVPKESADATKTTKLNKNTSKKSPETGNDSETALLLAFLLSCGGAIVVTGAYGKRKKHI